jgi:hypothetical protein
MSWRKDPISPSITLLKSFRNPRVSSLISVNLTVIVRRVLIVGPSGSNRKENALALGEYFGWTCISMGDLLKKEVSKKTELAQAI